MNWKNLFRFASRAGREEFAAVGLICNLLSFGTLIFNSWMTNGNFSLAAIAIGHLLFFPVSLLVFWVGLALYSRRLHDFNLSLWWYFIYVCLATGISLSSHTAAVAVSILGVCVWAFLALKKAPEQENRFGKTAEPFLPHIFGKRIFYATVILGILVTASMAGFSLYNIQKAAQTPYSSAARF